MYEGFKSVTGPTSIQTVPRKSNMGAVITDSGKQMERWVEHYLELYSTENLVTDAALTKLSEGLPVMENLDK